MTIQIENKLDIMKLQYAVIKAQWDEITADEHAAERDMDSVGEKLLQAEEALREEFLDVAGQRIGTTGEEYELLESISFSDKFFEVIMR